MYHVFMAMRGAFIGNGYIANRGMVRVFQDMDNTGYFFCLLVKRDETLYVHRSQVQFRELHLD